MGREIRDIEELSYISGASSGGNHGKDAERKGCGGSTQSAVGHSDVA